MSTLRVLLALLLWLGWPCAAPPPPLLEVMLPILFGVGVICDPIVFLLLIAAFEQLHVPKQHV